ncbi:MAG: DUF2341 domain-containing protein [Candidatus Heimdallarchaeota archaeon]
MYRNNIKKNLFVLGLLLINVLVISFPLEEEGIFESDHPSTEILRASQSHDQDQVLFHNIPRLTKDDRAIYEKTDYNPPGINLRISDYYTPGWADTRFNFRKNITIDSTKVSGDLTNFPIYIDLYDSDLPQNAQASGNDILFTNNSGHLLDHEIETYDRVYNSTHAHLTAWIKTNISSSQDTVLSMYYGYPGAIDQSNPRGVWDDNYEFVLHMNQDPSSSDILDSTSNGFDFDVEVSSSMTSNDLVVGQTGTALALDGTDDFIYLPLAEGFVGPTDKFTFEFWIMFPNGGPGLRDTLAIPATSFGAPHLYFFQQSEFKVATSGSTYVQTSQDFQTTVGTWQHIVAIWDGTGGGIHQLYLNGSLDANDPTPLTGTHVAWNTLSIGTEDLPGDGPGGSYDNARNLHATISEFRLSNVVRSVDWINTEYENQNSPKSFYSVSLEEKHSNISEWHLPGFKYRKGITIDATEVSGGGILTNFPVLIDLYDSDLHHPDKVQADGDDIVFSDASGNLLDHEIELFDQNYDSTNAHMIAWIEIPSLSGTVDTEMFMYFGNKGIGIQQNPTGVWDSNYIGVWHLNQDPSGTAPQIIDSTAPATHGTSNGSMTSNDLIAGKIGYGLSLDGADDFIDFGNPSEVQITGAITVESWFRALEDQNEYLISKNGPGPDKRSWDLSFDPFNGTHGKLVFRYDTDGVLPHYGEVDNVYYEIGQWHHVVGVFSPSNYLRMYLNGQLVYDNSTAAPSQYDAGNPLRIGARGDDPPGSFYNGSIDEARISNIARSSDWVITGYKNQFDPNGFSSIGSIEIRGNWTLPYLRFKKSIAIKSSEVYGTGNLYNFPVLIDLYDSDLRATEKVQTDGDDIAFTDANGARLDHEIELFDQSFNLSYAHLMAWVKIPILSGTTDTTIYMWYGNSAVKSLANPIGVWQDYGAVWHLNDDFLDSTANNNDGTNYQSTDVGGKIADGQDFDGINDYINVGSDSSIDNIFNGGATISAWIYPEGWGGGYYGRILDKAAQTAGTNGWVLCIDGTGNPYNHLLFYRDFSTSRGLWYTPTDSISLNQWQYVVVAFDDSSDSNAPKVYINGILQTLTPEPLPSGSATTDAAQSLYIGNFMGGGRTFDGTIDEPRIAYNYLSSDWIQTEFNNQINPSNFYTIGLEEERLWADTSFRYSKDISINQSEVSSDFTDFPVLIDIIDSDLKSGKLQSDASDILFIDSIGVKLDHEIESFTQSGSDGHLTAWVRVPYLYDAEDTVITMYYGNSKISNQENPDNVWDSNFRGVWHLSEDPSVSQIFDSTSYNNHGTATNLASDDQESGQIDGSIDFDNVQDQINYGDKSSLNMGSGDFSLSLWFNYDGVDKGPLAGKGSYGSNGIRYYIAMDTTQGLIKGEIDDNGASGKKVITSTVTYGDNLWHHAVLVRDGNYLRFYIDGVEIPGSPIDITGYGSLDLALPFYMNTLASDTGGTLSDWTSAKLDEVQVSNSVRTADWISAQYTNQHTPTSFYSVGTEFYLDKTPPVINDYGTEDPGTGSGRFWADVSDATSSVNRVKIKINTTEYDMSFNGSYWIYIQSVNYGDTYEYQISNASDVRDNYITSPSSLKLSTFTADTVKPYVDDWEYFPGEGQYGTFKANVSDSWGIIDKVIVNVTVGNILQGYPWALMVLNETGYINNTIAMNSGTIKFVVRVNDTAGNNFTSGEHQGYVPIINHYPVASDITLSRSQSEISLPIYSNSTLYLNYTFYDADGDDEGGTEIRWYLNGALQSAYNNLKEIPATALNKDDFWNVTVRPKDGKDFGVLNSSSIIAIQNTPPTVTSASIIPVTPYTTSDLSIDYVYYDNDGDTENTLLREIYWFKDSVLQDLLNGSTTILAGNTTKGESWYYKIIVNDGFNSSGTYTSSSVIIANSAPTATVLTISPSNPTTSSDLTAGWTFNDADGDSEITYFIEWIRGVTHQPIYDGLTTLPAAATTKTQVWYFKLIVNDGTDNSSVYTSPSVNILNTAPTASGITITSNPLTSDILQASWTFNDVDGDSESTSWIIRWYKDNVLLAGYNDLQTVPSSATSKGEAWNYTVRVHDGTSYSIQYNSSITTILNSPPTASGLTITNNPTTNDALIASWTFNDIDGDTEDSNWIIHWYKDNVLQAGYTNLTTVSSSATSKGEEWNYTLQVYDGTDYSIQYESSTTVIINTPPTASGLLISPAYPATYNDLSASWTFNDADADSEIAYFIEWIRGVTHQPTYDGLTTLPAAATTKNQVWYFKLIVNDGTDNSSVYTSPSVDILNTAPTASGITITSNPLTNDILQASWTFNDVDGDSESTSWIIRWYKDNVLLAGYNDLQTVPSSATSKGEAWNYTVKVYDGTNYSIQYNSSITTILNSPPTASGLTITNNPTTNDALIASWTFNDIDGDTEDSNWIIYWYKDNVLQGGYTNLTTVSSSATSKGEEWNYTLRVYDGIDYSIQYNSVLATIANSAPIISGQPSFNKTSGVVSSDTLNVTYNFSDADSDPEITGNRIVFWYKNGNYDAAKDNDIILLSSETLAGQWWYYIIKVYDGMDYSQNYTSEPVSIEGGGQTNDPPIAGNLTLTLSPTTLDNLIADYDYYDNNSNEEAGTQIRWYKDGILQPHLNDTKTIQSSETAKGEVWNFTVRPKDGLEFGNIVFSSSVMILNTPPTASGLGITSIPRTSDDLVADWTFNDVDGDTEDNNWIIYWYKDNVLQGGYTNLTTVSSTATSKGEVWNYTIQVYDGQNYSIQYNSSSTTILNTIPTASNLGLTFNPSTIDDLVVSYAYNDLDNDPESSSWEILWYKDNNLQPGLNGTQTVDAGNTSKNEFWHFTLKVHDGEGFSVLYISPSRKILNTAPTLTSVSVNSNPTTIIDLVASWTFSDIDNDDESTTRVIKWYMNGVLQPSWDNLTQVPASGTSKGELWNYTVRVYDGEDYSVEYISNLVIILNTKPISSSLTLTISVPKTSDNLIADWSYTDIDGDPENLGWIIRWYKNDVLQPTLNDSKIVTAGNTTKDEVWYYILQVFDGEEYSDINTLNPTITIANTKPSASSLTVTAIPRTTDDLVADYSYSDIDGDIETISWIIKWYRDGGHYPLYDDLKIVPSSATSKNEIWYFTLQVHDGTNYSSQYTSPQTQILNSAPSASSVFFSPALPNALNNLSITYNWNDDDTADSEGGTLIRWYRNDILQQTYNDLRTVDSALLIKNERWNVSIRVSDGTDFGAWVNMSVIIANSAPTIVTDSAQIYTPFTGLYTTNTLVANWVENDADGDNITSVKIIWENRTSGSGSFIPISLLENLTEVPPQYTAKLQDWRFKIQVYDGQDWSVEATSFLSSIGNSEPIVENISLAGGLTTTDNIILNYDYYDADNDPEGSTDIDWTVFHLGSPSFISGTVILDHSSFTAGDVVWCVITPNDGTDDGTPVDSSKLAGSNVLVQVGNTAPLINTSLGSPEILSDHPNGTSIFNAITSIYVNYSDFVIDIDSGESDPVFDVDFEPNYDVLYVPGVTKNIGAQYRWYKFNKGSGIWELQFGLTTAYVDSFFLHRGEEWKCSVRPRDLYGDEGMWVNSTTITIGNSYPIITGGIEWLIQNPQTQDNLILWSGFTFDYYDFDNDPIDIAQTLILWFKNGQLINGPQNNTILTSQYFAKGDQIYVVIRPSDGINWALRNYTSSIIAITNTIPAITDSSLYPTTISNEEILYLDWTYFDLDNDAEGTSWRIWWFRNGVYQSNYDNSTSIPLKQVNNGEIWKAEFQVFDGTDYSILYYSTEIETKILQIDYIFDPVSGQVDPNVRESEFLVDDENLSISYLFSTQGDASGLIIRWFSTLDNGTWIERTEFEGDTSIDHKVTSPGEKWKCMISPLEQSTGFIWGTINSSTLMIESRPEIFTQSEEIVTPMSDIEGHYILQINTSDLLHDIEIVIFTLENDTVEHYAREIGNGIWSVDYQVPIDNFEELMNSEFLGYVRAVTSVNYAGKDFSIYVIKQFNIKIIDNAPPRVPNVQMIPNDETNPTNITFIADVEEHGSGVASVVLLYYLNPSTESNGGAGASYLQIEDWIEIQMEFQGVNSSTHYLEYSVTVPFEHNGTDWQVIYRIQTFDNAGNSNPLAYDIRNYPDRIREQTIYYTPPSIDPGLVIIIVAITLFIAFTGSIVYVKFIRKPELVGLDKELVLEKISDISKTEVMTSLDAHTVGLVVSFFDQRHGPIPIIVIPEILKDNFSKLVDLSDRSFSGTGFVDEFDEEVSSSYDFMLSRGLRTKVMSFGYSLERPEARGGQENLTANILIHRELFPLVNQFLDEIQGKVREIHVLMNEKADEKERIRKKLFALRIFVTRIILSYEQIYGTTELLSEDN